MSETKEALRKRYRQQRMALDLHTQHHAMAGILQQAEWMLPLRPNWVFSYHSSPQKVEPSVEWLLEWWRQSGADFQLCLPRVEGSQMVAVAVDDDTRFTTSAFGIAEPEGGSIVPPQDIDLVLVPLLAFDLGGFRVGYGKGFYDGYLKHCRPDALRVGLSWFEAEPLIADIAPYDIPLTHCITPNKVYVF